MNKFTESFFTPETSMEEYAFLAGKVEALIAFCKNKYDVKVSDVLSIIGYMEGEK